MNCVVCQKIIAPERKTCSWECAGKLSQSKRHLNVLIDRYKRTQKRSINDYIISCVNSNTPRFEHKPMVLEFFGGGVSASRFLEAGFQVVSAELDTKLYPSMREIEVENREFQSDYVGPGCEFFDFYKKNFVPITEDLTKELERCTNGGVGLPLWGACEKFTGECIDNRPTQSPNMFKPDAIYLDFCGPLSKKFDVLIRAVGRFMDGKKEPYFLFVNVSEVRGKYGETTDTLKIYMKDLMGSYIKAATGHSIINSENSYTYRSGTSHYRFYSYAMSPSGAVTKDYPDYQMGDVYLLKKKLTQRRKHENKKTNKVVSVCSP